MTESKSHECSACGGSGRTDKPAATYCASPVWRPEVQWNGRDYEYNPRLIVCPVCLGSGRVSDVTPASDAIADAETLQNVASHTSYTATAHLQGAHYYRHDDTDDGRPHPMVATRCARAAFHAVPGLRG